MSIARVELSVLARPWNIVIDVAQSLPLGSWTLVGGLMTKVHALLEGYESRATVDVDMLVDVMSSNANISRVVACLKEMSFKPQEPGFHHSPFYRMVRDDDIVDILLADHLPRGKAQRATYNGWPLMEVAGGAQAQERRFEVELAYEGGASRIFVPDRLGAIVLKCAAYMNDTRLRERHLEDIALLVSLPLDLATELERLHGSDKKRLRAAAKALSDPNTSAWMLLPKDIRIQGMDNLEALAG